MTTTRKQRKGDGRTKFLAHADTFRGLLLTGHPQRSIYDDYADVLGISYSQFNRYVGQYLLNKNEGGHQKGKVVAAVADPVPQPTTEDSAKPAGEQPAKKGVFTHNPDANKRTDLI
ncbi:hypothetical protein [Tatumella sp. UCD-D_suzukii]|uniref:hypothetical protein n=1 Tax=Tatumella sp. UCD-D_suzukii TaxID=1408192 RepID=UPI00046F5468|nr:hypothetical protein [Tatumella sp. UCD-D_suzukii]